MTSFFQQHSAQVEEAVCAALATGYTLIDTALMYENERFIGNVLKRRMQEGKLKREDIFVTTKVCHFYAFFLRIRDSAMHLKCRTILGMAFAVE